VVVLSYIWNQGWELEVVIDMQTFSSFVYDANIGGNQAGGETCDVRTALPRDESVQKLDQSVF
jgi:hypothetical protein